MEQVKQTNEEFVRGVWEWVESYPVPDAKFECYVVSVQRKAFNSKEAPDAWAAAAAYTRERLEVVRQLREEIAQQTELIDGTNPGPIIEDTEPLVRQCSILPESWRDGLQRTLARLESILADKTSGMKAGA